MKVRIIGVDFGTSTSLIRVKRYDDGKPVGDSYHAMSVTYGNGVGDSKAVTLVRANKDGTVTCGRYGEEETTGSTIYREFKMDLESEDPEKRQKARELTAHFFKYLYERYEHQTTDMGDGDDRQRTLISYPAKWKPETVAFMEQTARDAGFPEVSSMDEPTAALYAVLCRQMKELTRQDLLRSGQTGYVLLIDMGAGTTDLAICGYRIGEDEKQVTAEQIKTILVSTWPNDGSSVTFGGREVDRILEDYVVEYLLQCGFSESMASGLVKGKPNVKLWKEDTVSNLLGRNREVTTCSFTAPYTAIFGQSKPFPAFGREQFQQMLAEKLDQFRQLVTDCLDDAVETAPEIWEKGIDLVVLTGGHSSWYFTGELLDGTMPGLMHPALEAVHRQKSRILRLTNPQETVALGLVYSQLPFQVEKMSDEEQEGKISEEELEETEDERTKKNDTALRVINDDFSKAVNELTDIFDKNLMPGCVLPIHPSQYTYLGVPAGSEPFISFDSSKHSKGKSGTVFAKQGIFYRQGSQRPQFCSWRRFVDGILDLYSSAEGPLLQEGNETTPICDFPVYTAQIRVFLMELQKLVRGLLPKSVGKPKGKTRVNRFEEAISRYLSEQDPTLLSMLSRNADPDKLAQRLNIPAGETILFAHNTGSSGKSKYGTAFTGKGIYYVAWLEEPLFTPWEDVVRGQPVLSGSDLRITLDGTVRKVGELSVSDEVLRQYRQQWFAGLCAAVRG